MAQELHESPGGRPGLPVLNSPCGLCGCKATFEGEVITVDAGLVLKNKKQKKRKHIYDTLIYLSVDSKQDVKNIW